MKINILYSHYNVSGKGNKYRPLWFNYENCFKNLLETITFKPNITLHLIMDGKVENNWINKYKDKIIIHEIEGGTMEKAAMEMYRIAMDLSKNMDDKDLFYFLENDYLHINGWNISVEELYKDYGQGINYVSLYDHADKYNSEIYSDLTSQIFVTDKNHWRTVPSTCGSYIVSKKIFIEDYKDHTTVIGDHNKWLYLTENKNRFILTPIPGLSTHCMEGLLSPTIDWKTINNKQNENKVSNI